MRRWGPGPLAIYAGGIILPVALAMLRQDLMPVIGLPAYTALFWTGPFASAAAVVWSDWPVGWRAVWILLVPVFIALIFALLFMPAY